jgi:GT2 family glycosyltransferase
MKEVDVIIISWAKDEELHQVTKRGLDTLFESSRGGVIYNAIVVESNTSINYDEFNNTKYMHTCKTIYPKGEFNYNGYLNQGLKECNSEYVALCNSDLTYEFGWAEEIIKAMELFPEYISASPWCPEVHGNNESHIGKLYEGYEVRKELAGWCIFQQRKIYEVIEKLNEEVKFWFSDNILSDELELRNIGHILVPASVVHHHDKNIGKTADTLNNQLKFNYTNGQYVDYINARNKLIEKINKTQKPS